LVLTFLDLRKALCQFVKMLPFLGVIHDVDLADQGVLQLLRNPNPKRCLGMCWVGSFFDQMSKSHLVCVDRLPGTLPNSIKDQENHLCPGFHSLRQSTSNVGYLTRYSRCDPFFESSRYGSNEDGGPQDQVKK
jgi:hypothetical protein